MSVHTASAHLPTRHEQHRLFQSDLQCTEQHRKGCKNTTCFRRVLKTHIRHKTIHIIPGQIFFFLEPAWAMLKWRKLGRTTTTVKQGTTFTKHCNTTYIQRALHAWIEAVGKDSRWLCSLLYFFLNHYFPSLLIDTCSTKTAAKRNNL